MDNISISAGAGQLSGFTYRMLDDNTAEIEKYCGSEKEVTVPAAADGRAVTSIGKKAFGFYHGEKTEGFTIKGFSGTAAEKYAADNGIGFAAI